MEASKELHRDSRGLPWLDGILQDVRYAVRGLQRSPGFAAVAVMTLAVAIGINAGVFTVAGTVLFGGYPQSTRKTSASTPPTSILRKLRAISPAPARSTIVTAISAVIRSADKRLPLMRPAAPRPPSFSVLLTSSFESRRAGARPNRSPAKIETPGGLGRAAGYTLSRCSVQDGVL
jgi:hypothetical protein